MLTVIFPSKPICVEGSSRASFLPQTLRMLTRLLLSCALYAYTHAYLNSALRSARAASVRVGSFGDPNQSPSSLLQGRVQELFRFIDNKVVFTADPDTPGLTFPTPVEWAPWMETIWFGNAYDYRSSYFHDVMYSNNVPYKEGALLFKDKVRASRIAMVYQRYRKFDQSSYSLSNGTFFNIFGAETIRSGRYKVPLNEKLILCVTDPLTFSELRRYLNSFNALKWFKSKFFQLKRKRRLDMALSLECTDFFDQVVHFIEYGRTTMKTSSRCVLPILPVDVKAYTSDGYNDIAVHMSVANSQYFLESLFQAVFIYMSQAKGKILLGGDGRMLNSFAMETFLRVAAGNRAESVLLSEGGVLTTSMARAYLKSNPSVAFAVVLTAPTSAGGLRGRFGMVLVQRSEQMDEGFAAEIVALMRELAEVQMMPVRPPTRAGRFDFGPTRVSSEDALTGYVASLASAYDLGAVRRYLEERDVLFSIDCSHGGATPAVRLLLKRLGVDAEACLLNGNMSEDLDGRTPRPVPEHCLSTMELFNCLHFDSTRVASALKSLAVGDMTPEEVDATEWVSARSGEDCAPDVGFVLDADGRTCMAVGSLVASQAESRDVLLAYGMSSGVVADGLQDVLGWLSVLSLADAAGLHGIEDVLKAHWKRYPSCACIPCTIHSTDLCMCVSLVAELGSTL